MSFQQLIFAFAIILLVMVWYSTSSLRGKIFVTYTKVDGTEEEFLQRIDSRFLIFDKKKFKIRRKCIRYLFYKRGIHSFFPTRVAHLHYVWNSQDPIDPETGEVYVDSPEARQAMNQEERFLAYNRAQQKTSGKRESPLAHYLPYIAIGITVIMGLYLWMQQRGLNASITMLANYYKSLTGGAP